MWIQARGRRCPRSVSAHKCTNTFGVHSLCKPKNPIQKGWSAARLYARDPTGLALSTRSNMDCIKALICQISRHLARLVYTLMSLGESFLLLKWLSKFSCRCNAERARAGLCHFLWDPVDLDQCHWSWVAVVPPTLAEIEFIPVWMVVLAFHTKSSTRTSPLAEVPCYPNGHIRHTFQRHLNDKVPLSEAI